VRVLAYPAWLRTVPPRGISGRVLAAFRRSAYVQFGARGPVLALVSPELGRGPLNVLVDGLPWEGLQPGEPAFLAPTHLQVAAWEGELPPAYGLATTSNGCIPSPFYGTGAARRFSPRGATAPGGSP
jgi:hypothetical protein